MIEIDGSFGEGGGQIVRTAVSLSAVTGRPVRISNIRQGRPKPGLAAQHVQAITTLAGICRAETSGVNVGSSTVSFSPGAVRGGRHVVDIGTAGSVTLLMQCLLPALLRADGTATLEVTGGTDVKWAPTVDYFASVFLPALRSFGAIVRLDEQAMQRGYYPRGGGRVSLLVEPGHLGPARFSGGGQEDDQPARVRGVSHCSNLPEHVATRQAKAAEEALHEAGYESAIDCQVLRLPSTGSGITLWRGGMGASSLGERGLPAEKVGRTAATMLIAELASRASVDVHLADQLIVYLALAGGELSVREVSLHASTNIWTVGHFLDAEIEIHEDRERGIFRIESRVRDSSSRMINYNLMI